MSFRLTPAVFAHGEAVLTALLKFEHPADAVVSRYFREHKALGHADRGWVAETVFAVLRRYRSLGALCGERRTPRALMLAALVRVRGVNMRELAPVLRGGESDWLSDVAARSLEDLTMAERCDWPDWLYHRLCEQYVEAALPALADALNHPAPLDLRVNTLMMSREAALEALAESGLAASPTPYSPLGIRLRDKPALARHPLFQKGAIEVQDEGSQLLGLLLEARRGEMVADFCAGAGGKTLLLGAQMKNTGRLYAFDVSDKRLANLKPRLARSGLSNVHPVRIEHERDPRVRRLAGKLDRVLVDAPCSGLGTLRRNPDLKWRQTEASVLELNAKQSAILASAASLLKPGGRLVYATCSLLTAENEAIVAGFLQQHANFVQRPVGDIFNKLGIALDGADLHLLPHVHQTDGFYAAVLERQS